MQYQKAFSAVRILIMIVNNVNYSKYRILFNSNSHFSWKENRNERELKRRKSILFYLIFSTTTSKKKITNAWMHITGTHRKSFCWWCIFLNIRRIPFNSRKKYATQYLLSRNKKEIYTPQSEYMKYKHMDWSNLNANDRFKWVDDLFNI